MPGSGEMTNLFERGFQGLEGKARECGDKFNAAVHHINDWRFVLGPAMLVIRPGLETIRDGLEKLFKLIRTAVEHHMPVVSLIWQSFNWVEKVQAPVNGLTPPENRDVPGQLLGGSRSQCIRGAKMATGFIGALVTASIEGATVVEIPFAVKDLASAIGTLVTQALDNLVGIAKRFAEALSKVRDIMSMMTDGKLPERARPQAVNG